MHCTVSPGAFKVIDVPPLKLEGVIVTALVPPVDTFKIILICRQIISGDLRSLLTVCGAQCIQHFIVKQ